MKLLKPGDRGIYVEYLSLALKRAGFDVEGIKTELDAALSRSLTDFQRRMSITPDGICGEVTWSYLLPYLRGYITLTLAPGQSPELLADTYLTTREAISIANPMLKDFVPGSTVIIPLGFDVVATNVSYSHELTELILDGLVARYPFVSLRSAGISTIGRPLRYLVIGTGQRKMLINAAHHANEWITTPVSLKFAEDMLKAIVSLSPLREESAGILYSTKKLFVMPLVNPDGVDLVTGAIDPESPYYDSARAIGDSYPDISFPSGWKANIGGTDLNLNYPASWERAKQIKYANGYISPAPRDFVGSSPLSAIESRNLYNLSLMEGFDLTVSLHTQGDVIYWKYLDLLPPRSEEIAQELARVSGYTMEITPYSSGFAGYKDWYISYYNRPGYTIEIGRGQNPLPIDDFDSIYPACQRLLSKALALA